MEYHKQLITSILDEESLEGFEREQRRDELEHLSTEDLEGIRYIYFQDGYELEENCVWNRV